MSDPKPRKKRSDLQATPEVLAQVCEALASGMTLTAFCDQPGRPSRRSIVRQVEGDPEWCARFTAAREQGFDAMAEEALRIADAPAPTDKSGKTDMAAVQLRRLQVDVRLRLLSKWCSARYGDKLHLEGGNVQLEVIAPIQRNHAELRSEVMRRLASHNGNGNGRSNPHSDDEDDSE